MAKGKGRGKGFSMGGGGGQAGMMQQLQQMQQQLAEAQEKLAVPDILINNAGINVIDSFEEIKVDDFNRIHQINVAAPFSLCRAVIPGMREKAWGRIVR